MLKSNVTFYPIFCVAIMKFRRCSKKVCCKQCRYVKFTGTMTKWPVQKPTHRTTQKHVERKDNYTILEIHNFSIEKNLICKTVCIYLVKKHQWPSSYG